MVVVVDGRCRRRRQSTVPLQALDVEGAAGARSLSTLWFVVFVVVVVVVVVAVVVGEAIGKDFLFVQRILAGNTSYSFLESIKLVFGTAAASPRPSFVLFRGADATAER